MRIFIRTLVLGPLFSAATFSTIIFAVNCFSRPNLSLAASEALGTLLVATVGAYIMAFTPLFGPLPGVIPLLVYSLSLTYLADKVCNFLSKQNATTRTKVFTTTVMSILIGTIVYGAIFLFTLEPGESGSLEILWALVAPTSAIFGAWTGLSYARETTN